MIIEDDSHDNNSLSGYFNSHGPPTGKMLYVMLKVVQTKNVLTFKNLFESLRLEKFEIVSKHKKNVNCYIFYFTFDVTLLLVLFSHLVFVKPK